MKLLVVGLLLCACTVQAAEGQGHHHHNHNVKNLRPQHFRQHKGGSKAKLLAKQPRFRALSKDEPNTTDTTEAGKIHIDSDTPKPLVLTGSEAKVGSEAKAETENTEDNNGVEQISTFSGSAYSAGLADEAQSDATIDSEMADQLKQISQILSDETKRATKSEDQIKTDFTDNIEKNKQERQTAEKNLDTAINKEQNARKQADDDRSKSENDVTQNLDNQLSKLNDKVSECSQNVQKAVQKANSLESIVNAYTDKKGGGTKIAFVSEYEHINNLHRLHAQFERMQARHGRF